MSRPEDVLKRFGITNTSYISNKPSQGIDQRPVRTNLPTGRSSQPSESIGGPNSRIILNSNNITKLLREVIPIIRNLMVMNENVSQVMHNIVTLGNTGHKIFFDRGVDPLQVDKMRNHLVNKRKEWATGQAGMDGLVNKMFYQILVGGAIANEWVPNKRLEGIEGVTFVNPEDINFQLKTNSLGYDIFQRVRNGYVTKGNREFIPLNPNTFKYYALNGDTDLPYGIPPYVSVIPKIDTQKKMNENIDYVVDEFGIIGFLEVLLEKPQMDDLADIPGNNNQQVYDARLDNLLIAAKERLKGGMRDGIVAGWKDDHEFKFNSFSKDYGHVSTLYQNNELGLYSALKHDATLAGRNYNSSETQISVVFMKMLSELRNIQNQVKANLEFGYALELMLAGYKFDYLQVQFNRSTIQDDLKYQQAEEIKIRNVEKKLILGMINQDQAADELSYETPAFAEPKVAWDVLAGQADPEIAAAKAAGSSGAAQKKQIVKKGKNESAKKSRATKKPIQKVNK